MAHDMVISDSFHRVKRTLLLLSTGLIVLSLTSPLGDKSSLNLGVTSLELPLTTIRILLIIGGGYYWIGLLLEAFTAASMNIGLMKRWNGTLHERMDKLRHIAVVVNTEEHIKKLFDETHNQVVRFSRSTMTSRKLLFYGWEVAAPSLYFLAAVVSALVVTQPPATKPPAPSDTPAQTGSAPSTPASSDPQTARPAGR